MNCGICKLPLPFLPDSAQPEYKDYYGYWWNDQLVHVACVELTHVFTEMEDMAVGKREDGSLRYLGHSDVCYSIDDRKFWHEMLDTYLDAVKQYGSVKWTLHGMCSIRHGS